MPYNRHSHIDCAWIILIFLRKSAILYVHSYRTMHSINKGIVMEFKSSEMKNIYNKLLEVALAECDKYYSFHTEMNKRLSHDAKSQSYLMPVVRVKKEGLSMAIIWRKSYFVKRDGKAIHQSKHLPKGKGTTRYNTGLLIKNAPSWEHEMIIETESVLANIRAAQAQVTKIGIHARLLNKRLKSIKTED